MRKLFASLLLVIVASVGFAQSNHKDNNSTYQGWTNGWKITPTQGTTLENRVCTSCVTTFTNPYDLFVGMDPLAPYVEPIPLGAVEPQYSDNYAFCPRADYRIQWFVEKTLDGKGLHFEPMCIGIPAPADESDEVLRYICPQGDICSYGTGITWFAGSGSDEGYVAWSDEGVGNSNGYDILNSDGSWTHVEDNRHSEGIKDTKKHHLGVGDNTSYYYFTEKDKDEVLGDMERDANLTNRETLSIINADGSYFSPLTTGQVNDILMGNINDPDHTHPHDMTTSESFQIWKTYCKDGHGPVDICTEADNKAYQGYEEWLEHTTCYGKPCIIGKDGKAIVPGGIPTGVVPTGGSDE